MQTLIESLSPRLGLICIRQGFVDLLTFASQFYKTCGTWLALVYLGHLLSIEIQSLLVNIYTQQFYDNEASQPSYFLWLSSWFSGPLLWVISLLPFAVINHFWARFALLGENQKPYVKGPGSGRIWQIYLVLLIGFAQYYLQGLWFSFGLLETAQPWDPWPYILILVLETPVYVITFTLAILIPHIAVRPNERPSIPRNSSSSYFEPTFAQVGLKAYKNFGSLLCIVLVNGIMYGVVMWVQISHSGFDYAGITILSYTDSISLKLGHIPLSFGYIISNIFIALLFLTTTVRFYELMRLQLDDTSFNDPAQPFR